MSYKAVKPFADPNHHYQPEEAYTEIHPIRTRMLLRRGFIAEVKKATKKKSTKKKSEE